MLVEIISYIMCGLVAGLLSGMFGLGGGVIIVPGLSFLLVWHHFNSALAMHMAIGSSLLVMVFSTTNSFFNHRKHNSGYWNIYGRLVYGLIPGIFVGAVVGHYLHGHVLRFIFGALVLLIGVRMLFSKKEAKVSGGKVRELPGAIAMTAMGGLIGVVAALLGVGCGFITVPFLVYRGVETHLAIMVSAMVGATIGVLGSILNMYLGWSIVGLPLWSTGYVYWPACICIAFATFFTVPLGVKIAYKLPAKQLGVIFGIVLSAIGLHMLV